MEHTAFFHQRDYLLHSVDQHSSSLLASELENCTRVNENKVFTAGADLRVPLLIYVKEKGGDMFIRDPLSGKPLLCSNVISPSLRACAAFRNSLLTDYHHELHMCIDQGQVEVICPVNKILQ